MSCKSALYASNTSNQTLAVGDTINFGSAVRRFGCNCNISGGNVTLDGSGYYSVNTNITFTATAAGTAIITLYKDGAVIPGATSSLTVTADGIFAVNIPAIVRQMCACDSTITAIVTGVAVTVNNAAVTAGKL